MYISCIFHVVCASFSALATRKLADAKAVFSGIWALRIISTAPHIPLLVTCTLEILAINCKVEVQ